MSVWSPLHPPHRSPPSLSRLLKGGQGEMCGCRASAEVSLEPVLQEITGGTLGGCWLSDLFLVVRPLSRGVSGGC